MTYQAILNFWFEEITPQHWYIKDAQFDADIASRFGDIHRQANAGELADWRDNAAGCLAEIIVLDQFSRNMWRDTPGAFASDNLALCLAQHAIAKGFDMALEPTKRNFMYMPFMHSESALIHEQALQLFNQVGLENGLNFELKHQAIIQQFGRYPHRNAILGRISNAAEIAFLMQDNSSF